MVFMQTSEASQANAQQLAIAQTTIEALAELLRQLLGKQEELLQEKDGNTQQPDAPSSGFSDAEWDRYPSNGIRTSWMTGGADIRLHQIALLLLRLHKL
jgi:hypothetical protein